MTASVGQELLAAIRAAPDDRALRLVYADWLMERGDPRGEWIALSCGQDTEDTDREMRRRALWQHYGKQWESEDCADSGLYKISYRDGFPHYARLGSPTHLGSPQLKLHPIRTLTVHVEPGLLGAIADSPVLETVRNLQLLGDLDSVSEDELVAFLNASALEELGIWTGYDSRVIWPALARFRRIAELQRLGVDATIDVEQARWLGRSCPALETLACVAPSWDIELRALVETATFRLRTLRLDFAGHRLGSPNDAALADALASPVTRELTSLTLRGVEFGEQTAAALAQAPCAPTLRELRVDTENATLVHSLNESRFPALETLSLTSPAMTDDLVGVVARFPTLTDLELHRGEITRVGAERIMSSLPRLEGLGFFHVRLGDDGARAIAESPRARALRGLWFDGIGLGAGAIASIVESGHLNELRKLSLLHNRLDRKSVRALANGPFDRMARLCVRRKINEPIGPLLGDAWLPGAEPNTYERKLELSGRAVKVRAT